MDTDGHRAPCSASRFLSSFWTRQEGVLVKGNFPLGDPPFHQKWTIRGTPSQLSDNLDDKHTYAYALLLHLD